MGDRTKIEWTEASWTPIRAIGIADGRLGWHCEHVSEGCRNCYAETLNRRLGTGFDFKPGHRKDVGIHVDERMLTQPIRWQRGRMIFVCSMTDLFADFVFDEMIEKVFAVMALSPHHTFQVLTKRTERMQRWASWEHTPARVTAAMHDLARAGHVGVSPKTHPALYEDRPGIGAVATRSVVWPLPNVWMGTSVEDQDAADTRIPLLLDTPAAVRFISAEPLLGPVDLAGWVGPSASLAGDLDGGALKHLVETLGRPVEIRSFAFLDWVIVGGESGPHARPMHPDWARSLRDQCAVAGVAFLFKQWGEFVSVSEIEGPGAHHRFPDGATVRRTGKKLAGRTLDGITHDGFPA